MTADPTRGLSRRTLLKVSAAIGAAGLVGGERVLASRLLTGGSALDASRFPLPLPSNHPVEHIGCLMMENRSFDHYFGWFPGADGLLDSDGNLVPPRHPTSTGEEITGEDWGRNGLGLYCGSGHVDPDHSWDGGRVQVNGGAMDGFLKASADDPFALSYYLEHDLPVISALARNFVLHDRYFCSLLASTFPNREYLHSATSGGRQENDFPESPAGFPWETIWDRLEAAGVSWAYYFNDLPVLALWGDRFLSGALATKIRPVASFYLDAAAGRLPQVFFLDPDFVNEQSGNDDHPHADIRAGQAYIADIYHALRTSPQWPKTAFFVTYDEWGGFHDHVPPPRVRDARADASDPAQDFAQLGIRVPTVTISPWAPPGRISSRVYDHASILKFIEYRFGVAPLQLRDAAAANIGEVLDVSDPANPPNADPSVVEVPNPDPPCRLPFVPLDGESGPGVGHPPAYNPPSSVTGQCAGGSAAGAPSEGRDTTTHTLRLLADRSDLGRFDRRGHDPKDSYA